MPTLPYYIYFWFIRLAELWGPLSPLVISRVFYLIISVTLIVPIFNVSWFWLKKKYKSPVVWYSAATSASLVYIFAPWFTLNMYHYDSIWFYALLPLIFHFALKGIGETSKFKLLRDVLVISIAIVFGAGHYSIVQNFIFLALLILVVNVLSIREDRRLSRLKNSVVTLVSVIGFALLLGAYWSLPYFSYFRIEYATGQVWDVSKTFYLFQRSMPWNILHTTINFDALLNINSNVVSYWPTTMDATVLAISFFLVPIIASAAILFRPKDKIVLILLTLIPIYIFLGKGTNPPIGDLYYWLSVHAPFGWVLKTSSMFLGVLSFLYSFLFGLFISEVLCRLKSKSLTTNRELTKKPSLRLIISRNLRKSVLVVMILSVIVVSTYVRAYPLFTGDVNGWFSPISLPSEYDNLNGFLSSQHGDFSVMFVPQSTSFIWTKIPSPPKIEWVASSKPVILYGWGIATSPAARLTGNLAYWSLLHNTTRNVGEILSTINCKYLIYHNDTQDYASYSNLYNNILKQTDLEIVWSDDFLYVFQNEKYSPYLSASNRVNIGVGGLDMIESLSNIENFSLSNNPISYVEQSPISIEELNNLLSLNLEKTVVFYGEKDVFNLALDTLDSEYFIYPFNLITDTYPLSNWDKDSPYTHTWIPSIMQPFKGGAKYDFDLGRGFVHASPPANASFKINANTTEQYDVWARLLLSPEGGTISVSLGDHEFNKINTTSSIVEGFKWVKVGEVSLDKGTYKMMLSIETGFNVVNLLAVVPSEVLNESVQEVTSLILQSNTQVMYLTEGEMLETQTPYYSAHWGGSASNGYTLILFTHQQAEMSLYSLNSSDYVIAMRGAFGPTYGTLEISTDGTKRLSSSFINETEGLGWKSGRINLNKGQNKIVFTSIGTTEIDEVILYPISKDREPQALNDFFNSQMLPYVLDYKKVSPTEVNLRISAIKPFLLAFSEANHNLWCTDMISDHVNLFTMNGFYLNKTGTYTMKIEFIPERSYQIGVLISITSIISAFTYCVYLLKKPKSTKWIFHKE